MPTLDWIGKKAVVNHHQEVPYHLLRDVPELGCGPTDSGNLIVEGDNLTALKALLPYYAGQVKCIYIDPPYNTGNEGWVYNDNVNSLEIKAWLGKVVGKEAEDLSRHDKWLCMMFPRLRLLKEMLRNDGAIFISIDDAEVANLRILCDEIFGRQNLLANLVWEKGKKGDAKFFSVSHEYILVYARSKTLLTSRNTVWRRRKPGVDEALAKYQEIKSAKSGDHAEIRKEMMAWYRSLPAGDASKAHKHYNWSDDRGLYFPDNFHGPDDGRETRPRYDIPHPGSGKPVAKPSTGWRWEEPRTIAALAEKPPRIHFGPDETTIPCRKSYLFEVDEEPFPSVFYKDGRAATLEVERLLGKGAFEFPKDSGVIADLLSLVCKDGDLVLDSFAGSGTTGHACEILRKERDVSLRCILVELDKAVASTKTRARVASVGGTFRYVQLGHPLFDAFGKIRGTVRFRDLARHVFFTETGTPLPHDSPCDQPLLGVAHDTGVYLLYNGILKDRSVDGGNVLTQSILDSLPGHDGPKVIYAASSRVSSARLKSRGITFKQTPYAIKVR